MKFKSLQIGNTDLTGRRFNGQDLHRELRKRGYDSQHLVWEKTGEDKHTNELTYPFKKKITSTISKIEQALSIQSLLYPSSLAIVQNQHFQSADLVHYHLLHTGWFSMLGMPALAKSKPSILTMHDPWAMTGHCVYPRQCERWKTGCGSCPDLEVMLKMEKDNTHLMWQTKSKVFQDSPLDVIVASRFMENMVRDSPIFSRFKTHLVPFGINLDKFKPVNNSKLRSDLGIHPQNTVLCLRGSVSPFKGLDYILEALDRIKSTKPLTILTFEFKALFKKYLGKHQLIDLGWLEDEQIIEAYQASDIFLMPSTAEAFGVMAIEAMACAKPTIVFEDTSLPAVVFAPEGGLAVPQDSGALAAAIDYLVDNPNAAREIGLKARKLAEKHYDWEDHFERVLSIYEEILSRKTTNV